MKISDGGKISRMNTMENKKKINSWFLRKNYFTANLDTYAGNSGSPVFNKNTGKVEGIIIQGAEDFFYNEENNCIKSQRRSNSHSESYEKVMRITKIPGI
jgi:V8-like Glu-specific endopeptidase